MRILRLLFALELLLAAPVQRAESQEAVRPEQMQQMLAGAAELYESDLPKVTETLAPLLTQLRDEARHGTMTEQTQRIYQEALVLQMRAQTKLLADEAGVSATVRELLIANPHLDDSAFNPREKLLVEKIRSAETGRLGLQTNPSGADVIYLGVSLGSTPLDLPLLAGTYHLRLSKHGYRDEEFETTIRASEMLSMERPLRRRAVQLAMSVRASSVRVSVNGRSAGSSRDYQNWRASLTGEQRSTLDAAQGWGPDRASSSFLTLADITPGEEQSVELRAECYVPGTIVFKVPEEVDWNKPLTLLPELLEIALQRDTGTVSVASSPSGGTVLLDGAGVGKTPASVQACSGAHRVQVLHPAGQYVKSVLVKRDERLQVSGDLRPALAFLGIYSASGGELTPSLPDWEPVATHLSGRITSFSDPRLSMQDSGLTRAGALPLTELLRASTPEAAAKALAALATKAGSAELLLFGVRSGNGIALSLYASGSGIADVIEIPNVESPSLEYVTDQINRAGKSALWLQTPYVEVALVQSPRGLVVQKDLRAPSEARPPLVPGALVRSVDQKPMDYAELQSYLRTRTAGQAVTLQIAAQDTAFPLVLPVRFAAAEYPWATPQAFPNAIMAMLRHVMERDPASAAAHSARLSLARGLMQRAAWRSALELLDKTDLGQARVGVSQGTVLYYQGRCWEELQDQARAVAHYTRAAEYPDATLGMLDGLPIAELVQRRLQALKKPTQ